MALCLGLEVKLPLKPDRYFPVLDVPARPPTAAVALSSGPTDTCRDPRLHPHEFQFAPLMESLGASRPVTFQPHPADLPVQVLSSFDRCNRQGHVSSLHAPCLLLRGSWRMTRHGILGGIGGTHACATWKVGEANPQG